MSAHSDEPHQIARLRKLVAEERSRGSNHFPLVVTVPLDMAYGLLAHYDTAREDAERWRVLRDGWPNVRLTWTDEETGHFGGEHGDVPLYARTPTVVDDATDEQWQGATPDEAIDAARSGAGKEG